MGRGRAEKEREGKTGKRDFGGGKIRGRRMRSGRVKEGGRGEWNEGKERVE